MIVRRLAIRNLTGCSTRLPISRRLHIQNLERVCDLENCQVCAFGLFAASKGKSDGMHMPFDAINNSVPSRFV